MLEFLKTIVIFGSSTLEVVLYENFTEKMPKCEPKNDLFGYFSTRMFENNSHIGHQHLRICLLQKSAKKANMPKFGTKNALFGYFSARILTSFCQI